MTETTFYHAFEAAFRGSRAEIMGRLKVYFPFLTPLLAEGLPKATLDLGCGRGEWLETLQDAGFAAHGVDLDEGMLSDCRTAGLSAENRDAIEALASAEDDSLSVVSAFHLIEHLPFDTVRGIVDDALRALAPGGLLILETPNPENIEVGTVTFHNDSTHVAPVPPNVIKFLAEHSGYAQIAILRLNAATREPSETPRLSDVIYKASPDYALVAQKAGPAPVLDATRPAFDARYGPSTRDLAERHDWELERLVDSIKPHSAALMDRITQLDGKIAELQSEIAWLKKAKKTKLYYRSKKIQKLDKKITRWLIDRRERRRARKEAARRAANRLTPRIDRTRPWDPVDLPEVPRWRIEGPFDSTYSLALVNREFARALARKGVEVSLKSSEGPGDFDPDPAFLEANPDLAAMQPAPGKGADLVSRNMYPPRVEDMPDTLPGLHSYAWEETGFPRDFVSSFNDTLRFLMVTSEHVKKIMVDNGVYVPTYSVGNGVDHFEAITPEPMPDLPRAGTVFLHVSSCFPRKGADTLLAAWAQAFSAADDVVLILKTFPNPHNDVADRIARLRLEHPQMAPIHLIDGDITDGQMRGLYDHCDIAVFPSRAEGFGLPIAEAILAGKRVLTTGWSGQMEFAQLPLVTFVDYRFDETDTHLGAGASMWAEPDVADMAAKMRRLRADAPPSDAIVTAARTELLTEFSWDAVAERSLAAVRDAAARPKPVPPRVGWVTTYNARCGIATYSEHLIRYLGLPVHVLAARTDAPVVPDSSLDLPISRCWKEGRDDDLTGLLSEIRAEDLQCIVLQFNYGFFNFATLARFIDTLKDEGRQVFVTLHATDDSPHPPEIRIAGIRDALARCDRLLVHKVLDANRLKDLGLEENVTLFPHGLLPMSDAPPPTRRPDNVPFVIGSYGFFLPNKGLVELIEATALLREKGRDVRLRMVNAEYPVGESRHLIAEARERVRALDLGDAVEMDTRFLSDDAALSKLSGCDLVVFGYQKSAESASGAVRYGLISGRPVAVTPLPIFSDVAPFSVELPGLSPEDMARGIEAMIDRLRGEGAALDPDLTSMLKRAHTHCDERSYAALGPRLKGMMTALWCDRA